MLDIQFIRNNAERVKLAVQNKGLSDRVSIDELLALDDRRKELLKKTEDLRSLRNKTSKEIGQTGASERETAIKKMSQLKGELKEFEDQLEKVTAEFRTLLLEVPNVYAHDVPVGQSESENVVVKKWGDPKTFDFEPRDHATLGKMLDILDTESAAEISGSRFAYIKGDLVLLQFALIQFVFETLTDEKIIARFAKEAGSPYTKPFVPMIPPVLMKQSVMKKTDRLDPIDDRYLIQDNDNNDAAGMVLIGSAEHTLAPLYMNKIVPKESLPIRYIGYSTAFRGEAGTYGKDTHGILRLHQFDKLEMESFTTAEDGASEQKLLVALQEYLMQQLEIPYQVVLKCTGDMGKIDFCGIDIEAWLPGEGKYRETHSADYVTDFQSRRLNARYKDGETLTMLHMNDATAFALGRTLIAIMENYQKKDGSIEVPKILRKYCGVKNISPKAI